MLRESIRPRRALFCSLLAVVASAAASARAAEDVSTSCAEHSEKAQRAHVEHKLLAARSGFRACIQSSCARFIRDDCETALRDVEKELPTVVIAVRTDRGEEVTAGQVWVDGVATNYLRGVQLELDPGLHTVLARADTGGEATLQIVAREGEKARIVSLVVPHPPSPAPAPEPPPPAPAPPKRTAEKVLVGVGLGLLVASATFDIAAYSRYHSLSDSCGDAGTCSHGDVSTTKNLALTGDALLGVGLATVAAGVIVYLVRGPGAPAPRLSSLLTFTLPE